MQLDLTALAQDGASRRLATIRSEIRDIERFLAVQTGRVRKTRGMSRHERQVVSRRMKRYWASWRAARARAAGIASR
jgi:hypothetical protein